MRAKVILFKSTGKYYTEEEWIVPEGAIGPYDMANSPDFRRIGGGAVLVETQEPWGYPHLFPSNRSQVSAEASALLANAANAIDQARAKLRDV